LQSKYKIVSRSNGDPDMLEWALYWHRLQEGSAQHAWLRGMVAAAVRSSGSKPASAAIA
jgi:hypothetical protein